MRVVVTGGGSGIGEAICERFFGRDGAQVEVLDIDGESAERSRGGGAPRLVHYCAAKAGIFGLVRPVAREVAHAGWRRRRRSRA